MRVSRRPVTEIAPDIYDRLVSGSFFASRGFLDLWRTMGGRPVAWVAETEGSIVAVLPGVEYGIGPITRFASLPDGCYGGVFGDPRARGAVPAATTALLDAIASRGYAFATVFDYYGGTGPHPEFDVSLSETRLVELAHEDWEPGDPKLRSEIRKAERSGVLVERFDWARDRDAFLELAASTARRHGRTPRYRARFYQRLADLAASDSRVRWRVCTHQGTLAASHIAFRDRDTLVSWQIYFDKRFSFAKPNQITTLRLCQEARREGVRWLNMGATPPNAPGVAWYKSRWGGMPLTFAVRSHRSGLGALLREIVGPQRERRPTPSPEREPVR